jgi:hypothetical protein
MGSNTEAYNERLSKFTYLAQSHTKFWKFEAPLDEIPSSNDIVLSKPNLEIK